MQARGLRREICSLARQHARTYEANCFSPMPPRKNRKQDQDLVGPALLKETCRRLRVARNFWKAHRNKACRRERERALNLYERLSPAERQKVPQVLRVWLRYRSEKYFGAHRTPPGRRA